MERRRFCEGTSVRLTSLEWQEVWNDYRSCKVRVGSNGNLLWEASVLLGKEESREYWNVHRLSREDTDLEACLEKDKRHEFDFEAKYHLGKANVDVVPGSRKKE
ncbi:hypothetical protein Tco_0289771 [Tanacetum coccineum]